MDNKFDGAQSLMRSWLRNEVQDGTRSASRRENHLSDVLMKEYDAALDRGLTRAQIRTNYPNISEHLFSCLDCFNRLLMLRREKVRDEAEDETQYLRGNAHNPVKLIEVLQDMERPAWVRAMAADYLGNCGGDGVGRALNTALMDKDEEVQEAAGDAMRCWQMLPDRFLHAYERALDVHAQPSQTFIDIRKLKKKASWFSTFRDLGLRCNGPFPQESDNNALQIDVQQDWKVWMTLSEHLVLTNAAGIDQHQRARLWGQTPEGLEYSIRETGNEIRLLLTASDGLLERAETCVILVIVGPGYTPEEHDDAWHLNEAKFCRVHQGKRSMVQTLNVTPLGFEQCQLGVFIAGKGPLPVMPNAGAVCPLGHRPSLPSAATDKASR
ncbi:MAG: hypothetical protein V4671_25060 [Armatimonadota bacterium]